MLCIFFAESIPRNTSGNNLQRHGTFLFIEHVWVWSCCLVPRKKDNTTVWAGFSRGRPDLYARMPGRLGVNKFLPTTGAAGRQPFGVDVHDVLQISRTRRVLKELCATNNLRCSSGSYIKRPIIAGEFQVTVCGVTVCPFSRHKGNQRPKCL